MANIVRDEGLILRNRRFKDTSLFITFFGRYNGKLKLLARGARRPKSAFGASLEPFTQTKIIFYRRETKEIYNLSDTEIINEYTGIRNSPRKIVGAQTICEFLDRATIHGPAQPRLYRLALAALRTIQESNSLEELRSAVYSFLLLGAGMLGFAPNLTHCVRCRKRATNIFSINYGGLVCNRAEDRAGIVIPSKTVSDLRRVYARQEPTADLDHLELIDRLVRDYLQYHIEGLQLSTLRFFDHAELVAH